MDIQSISINKTVKITYLDDNLDEYKVEGDRPHGDFLKAVERLTPLIVQHLDLFKLQGRIEASGLKVVASKKGKMFKFTGHLVCPNFDTLVEIPISTPKMQIVPYPDYFKSLDNDTGRPKDPIAFPDYLTYKEEKIINNLISEAEQYVNGKRKANEQGELFTVEDGRTQEAL